MSTALAYPDDDDNELPSGQTMYDAQAAPAGGTKPAASHTASDTHGPPAVGSNFPPASARSTPIVVPPEGPTFSSGSHPACDIHGLPAAAAESASLPGQKQTGTHEVGAGQGPILRSPLLGLTARVVDDLERVRDANQSRLRQLTRVGPDKDGLHRGLGLSVDQPDVVRLAGLVARLEDDYDAAVKNLERIMRAHPLGPWAKATCGIGDRQLARLLAAIGDPYWNDLYDRPRRVSELIAYCGFDPRDGVARKRQRGVKSNWSETARMRMHLIAESCMKQRTSPYRPIYDETRAKYDGAVHDRPCPQCHAKEPGSPLKSGHVHARALRAVAKQVLKDLWAEAKRLHESDSGSGQASCRSASRLGATPIAPPPPPPESAP